MHSHGKRLKIVEDAQHGPAESAKKPQKTPMKKHRTGNSQVLKKKSSEKTHRYLDKDEQALLAVKYLKLPQRRAGSNARGVALQAHCDEFDVCLWWGAAINLILV